MSVRSYQMREGKLTPVHTIPQFPADPREIVVDPHRPSVITRDNNGEDVWQTVLEGTQKWTPWCKLARSPPDQLNTWAMCLLGPNMITLFDRNSRTVKKYEFA